MRLKLVGRLFKEGKFWISEVMDLDIASQGSTQAEAIDMIKDAIETLVDEKGFEVTVDHEVGGPVFFVSANSVEKMISLFLSRARAKSGMSARDAAKKMKSDSPNAYARYERGDSAPTFGKLEELFSAVSEDSIILSSGASFMIASDPVKKKRA